jgi:hypothetical protein
VCDPEVGSTHVRMVNRCAEDEWLLSHAMLTLPLLETLKRKGLHGLHAAGLSRAGRGLILAGSSGSGKSTLAIALGRADFDVLGDDMLFLRAAETGLEVRGFADEIDVAESTAHFFPELRRLPSQARQPGSPKWSFRAEDALGATISYSCVPAALVLPSIGQSETSRLEPIGPQEALLAILPNVLLTQPAACQAHLAALARLTQETPCYRLLTGRDFDGLPALLGRLLE